MMAAWDDSLGWRRAETPVVIFTRSWECVKGGIIICHANYFIFQNSTAAMAGMLLVPTC